MAGIWIVIDEPGDDQGLASGKRHLACFKTRTVKTDMKPSFATFVLALVAIGSLMPFASSAQTNAADPAPTIAYWEKLNQTFSDGQGIEMLTLPGNPEGVTPGQLAQVMRDIAETEHARCEKAAKLPMLHVDPDLTLYAADTAQVRLKATESLNDLADAIDKQSQIASGGHLGAEFLFNVLNHVNDKEDGILWNAAKDQVAQTAGEVENMKPVLDNIQSDARNLRKAIDEFEVQSMKVRAILTQRYQREFDLPTDYMQKTMAQKAEFHLADRRIRKLLIGQTIDNGGLFNKWTFDDDREFVSFEILDKTKVNDATMAYEIETHVKRIDSGEEHDFHLRLVVGRLATLYHVVSISKLE